jgi:pimeloyl-ACP methyl ester carboxylesterase
MRSQMAMTQAIVIIGGYNSLWPTYVGMARHLEDLAGLPTIGVPLLPWHWWRAQRRQAAGDILDKLQQTVVWARRKFEAERFILVGHSAGGLIARLYLCDQPVWGRAYAGAGHVDALITLGSPHCGDRGIETKWFLSDEANLLAAGSPHAPQVRYRTVAGRALQGRQNGRSPERRAWRNYSYFSGHGDVWGDGTVPVESASLDGAEAVVLEGVVHSLKLGRNWYGDQGIIRRWWPGGEGHAG